MKYRIATVEDCAALTRLRMDMRKERDSDFREETLYANTLAFFQSNIAKGTHVAFLCEESGVIIGTAGLTLFEMPPTSKLPNGKVAKLMNMYTVPAHRKQGVAKGMLDFVIFIWNQCKPRLFIQRPAHGGGIEHDFVVAVPFGVVHHILMED